MENRLLKHKEKIQDINKQINISNRLIGGFISLFFIECMFIFYGAYQHILQSESVKYLLMLGLILSCTAFIVFMLSMIKGELIEDVKYHQKQLTQ